MTAVSPMSLWAVTRRLTHGQAPDGRLVDEQQIIEALVHPPRIRHILHQLAMILDVVVILLPMETRHKGYQRQSIGREAIDGSSGIVVVVLGGRGVEVTFERDVRRWRGWLVAVEVGRHGASEVYTMTTAVYVSNSTR